MAKQSIFTLFGVTKEVTQKMSLDIESMEINQAVGEFVESAKALVGANNLQDDERNEILKKIDAVDTAKSSGESAVKSALNDFLEVASKISKPVLSATLTAAASVVLQALG